jgi:uncharacterized protein YhfF
MNYLPEGCSRPDPLALAEFWSAAKRAVPELVGDDYQVRWIGLDAESTRQIFELIRAGDKRGTFTLPWIVERTGLPVPQRGDQIVLIDIDGTPTLVVRLTDVHRVVFGSVTAADTAIDGSPVRDPAIWKPLHTAYWGALLAPFGLAVSDDMPFWAEPFELLYDRTARHEGS